MRRSTAASMKGDSSARKNWYATAVGREAVFLALRVGVAASTPAATGTSAAPPELCRKVRRVTGMDTTAFGSERKQRQGPCRRRWEWRLPIGASCRPKALERTMRIHHLNCISSCPLGGRLMDGRTRSIVARGQLCNHCLLIEG